MMKHNLADTLCAGADKASVGPELIVVHRVKECTCCSKDEAFDSNICIIVNLSLMRPVARRSGLIYRLPDQLLACTYELQVHCLSFPHNREFPGFASLKRGKA